MKILNVEKRQLYNGDWEIRIKDDSINLVILKRSSKGGYVYDNNEYRYINCLYPVSLYDEIDKCLKENKKELIPEILNKYLNNISE